MSSKAFVYELPDYPEPLSVVGVDVTVLLSREVTGGQEITLQVGHEGSGPPPHSHPWDESFYVVSGSVAFTVNGKRTDATAGTFFHLPAETVHGFTIQEDHTVMLEITGAGSQSSEMFRSISAEVKPGRPEPGDVPKLVAILGRYGANVHS